MLGERAAKMHGKRNEGASERVESGDDGLVAASWRRVLSNGGDR